MTCEKVYAGTNGVIQWPFRKAKSAGGGYLDFDSEVSYVLAEFIQNGRVKASYTMGADDEVRPGTTEEEGIDCLEVEYVSELTSSLEKGIPVYIKVHIEASNNLLDVDGIGRFKVSRELFIVI